MHNTVIELSTLTGVFGYTVAFILLGSALSLLIGLEQLTGRKKPSRSNILLFILSILVSVILYNCVLINIGIPLEYPWAIFFCATSLFTGGPFNYLYYRSLVDHEMKFSSDLLPHLVMPAIALVIEVVFQMMSHENKISILKGVFSADFSSRMVVMVSAGIILGCIIHAAYLIFFLTLCLRLWNETGIKAGVRLLFAVQCFNILSLVPPCAWLVTGRREFMLLIGCMTTLLMVFIFLFNNRFPELFKRMERELSRKKYERSFLAGVNTGAVHARLKELMSVERVYRDYELNLMTLAGLLSLTTHQLSQFLNERLGMSFNDFINGYRIEEAKELLTGVSEMNILQVCFHTGFSSKSSFNNVFKKATGMTPSEYKNQNGRAI